MVIAGHAVVVKNLSSQKTMERCFLVISDNYACGTCFCDLVPRGGGCNFVDGSFRWPVSEYFFYVPEFKEFQNKSGASKVLDCKGA